MISFFGRDDWSIRRQHKVNSWIWDQIGLEFGNINVQGTIKSEGGGKGGDNLSNKSVQVGIGWSFNI